MWQSNSFLNNPWYGLLCDVPGFPHRYDLVLELVHFLQRILVLHEAMRLTDDAGFEAIIIVVGSRTLIGRALRVAQLEIYAERLRLPFCKGKIRIKNEKKHQILNLHSQFLRCLRGIEMLFFFRFLVKNKNGHDMLFIYFIG